MKNSPIVTTSQLAQMFEIDKWMDANELAMKLEKIGFVVKLRSFRSRLNVLSKGGHIEKRITGHRVSYRVDAVKYFELVKYGNRMQAARCAPVIRYTDVELKCTAQDWSGSMRGRPGDTVMMRSVC